MLSAMQYRDDPKKAAEAREALRQLVEAAKERPMPKGPRGEKRPADVVSNAIKVARIAAGIEEEEYFPDDGKDPAAKALGAEGGRARAESLSPAERSKIAKKAAAKRWKKK